MFMQKDKTPSSVLKKIIRHFGTQKKLADALSRSQQAISLWFVNRSVSIEGAIDIERATKGTFKRSMIRPDYFE